MLNQFSECFSNGYFDACINGVYQALPPLQRVSAKGLGTRLFLEDATPLQRCLLAVA